jgi:hypothetical protein
VSPLALLVLFDIAFALAVVCGLPLERALVGAVIAVAGLWFIRTL